METRSGNLVDPVYPQDKMNASIDLGTHQAKVTGSTCEVEVEMQFTPRAGVLFRVPEAQLVPSEISKSLCDVIKKDIKCSVELLDRSITIQALPISINLSGGTWGHSSRIVMVPDTSLVNALCDRNSIHRAVIHLFNFPKFYGESDCQVLSECHGKQTWRRCGRVELKANGWCFTIAAMKDTKEREEGLREQGGYHLTHVAQTAREDDAAFVSQDLNAQVNLLHEFLSFVLGRWAGVGLTCGYNDHDKMVFEEWGVRHMHPDIRHFSSWFCPHRARMICDVFPGFARLQDSPVWCKALKHIIHWYIAANDLESAAAAVEVQVVHAQIALETLAWTLCVQDKRMVSKNKFKGSTAADTVRLLLSSCDTPRDIPAHMSPLLQGMRDGKWSDGPDAIAQLRNHVVHPDRAWEIPPGSFYEAGQLALWYVEMALLHIVGYKGDYASRLMRPRWVGQTEPVPWSQ